MDVNDLVLLLNMLIKLPSTVREVKEEGFNTDFGLIELDCLGSCIKITLLNNSIVSVDITDDKDLINDLFSQIKKVCTEFGIFLLKDRLNKCNDIINNNSINKED